MPKPQDYADALRDLDAMRASGQIDQAAYDVHRARLLAESSKAPTPLAVRILVNVLLLAVILFVVLYLIPNIARMAM